MPYDPLYLPAGSLRHSITIQAANAAERDAAGQPISGDWTTILTTRAMIRTLAMAEQQSAESIDSRITDIITIRYPGSTIRIVSGQRAVFGSLMYLIQDVENVQERNRVLNLRVLSIDQAE